MLDFRPFSSSEHTGYRFGFNGMEKDDEVYNASGTSYDFGARMYSSRLGRWSAVDPLAMKYAWGSPYSFVANKPTVFVDPDGRIITYNFTSEDAQKTIMAFIEHLRTTSQRFERIYRALEQSSIEFTITDGSIDEDEVSGTFNQYKNTITYDLRWFKTANEFTVIEETFHAYQSMFYGFADLIDQIEQYSKFGRTNVPREYPTIALNLGSKIVKARNSAESHWFDKNKTFIESEAKLFKYLVGYESLSLSSTTKFTEGQLIENDFTSGGGVGQKYLKDAKTFYYDNVSKDISLKAMRTFFDWSKTNNIDSYQIGGAIDKGSDALNSTSEPIEDYRPPTDSEIQDGEGQS